MTDLKNRFMLLLSDEPEAPDDLDRIVGAGRRARRRRHAALAVAGTAGAAGLTAAVVVPVLASAGNEGSAVRLGTRPPSPTPSASAGRCYLISAPTKDVKQTLARLLRSGRGGPNPSVKQLHNSGPAYRSVLEVCPQGADSGPQPTKEPEPAAGPPYHYTEDPTAIASRLGTRLHDRVTGFGLTITYSRQFAQETSKMDAGNPSYFDGNVDVHETNGYADIGVQVTHATTEQVPFDGDCTAADHCAETKLPDGSVVRTGEAKAGPGMTVLTAEVHRPDGVVVQAQMSNYPFGPDAGSQPHGDQPLTMDQLISLAEDAAFTF